MLKRFSAKRYKNVEVDGLDFARVTVLVGPNNGGKSNLIEALRFYSDAYMYEGEGSAFHAIVERRGYGEILRRSVKPPGTIELRWEHDVGPARHAVNDIAFRVGQSAQFPAGFHVLRDTGTIVDPATNRRYSRFIDDETKQQVIVLRPRTDAAEVKFSFDFDPSDFFIRLKGAPQKSIQVATEDYPFLGDSVWWVSEVSGQRYFTGSLLEPRKIAASAKRNLSILHLDETGSELVNVLNNLERRHNDFLIPYEDHMREALPRLERIRIDDVSDQYKSMKLRIDGDWFRLDELSEGTLKMLALALLFFTPEKTSLLSIDEPELNLHPAWLRVLGKWMLGATGTSQVLASTHSPDLLDALTEGFRSGDVALIVCDAKKGFRNVSPKDLDDFFKEGWELGDLYRVGEPQLGGWPW
jgi:hypothetical protein